jgi:outer membrane protein OmpA-like peptidoglycan-associated protein
MKQHRIVAIAIATLLFSLATGLAQGEGKKVKVKGLIATRTGDTLTLKTKDGSVTVALDDDTKVQQPKGLGLRKKQESAAVLIPGLRVTVEGTGDLQSQVTAKSITFDGDDLETAEMIQAGLTPTAKQVQSNQQNISSNKEAIQTNQQGVAANKVQLASQQQQISESQEDIEANQRDIAANSKRFSDLADYDIKGDLTVNFAVGSSTISADDKAALAQLAQKATGLSGYLIQVKGFADSSGNAAMNQQLSMDRAQEVIAYLIQDCKIPVRHVVAPGAMGTADPAATNETAQGRTENRRVEVKVLVNRGVAGG